jgi:hypothetical protein
MAKTFFDLGDSGIFARPAHGASSVIRGVKVLDSGGNSGGVEGHARALEIDG